MDEHHDSGYFPGLSNAAAWVVLGIAGFIIAVIVVGIVLILILRR